MESNSNGAQDTVTYTFDFDVKGDAFTGTVKIINKKEEATGQITDGKSKVIKFHSRFTSPSLTRRVSLR
ncbi:MAG: hypothetical protein ABR555_16030 [Pyrinomonadaceae bacterium]